MASVDEEPVGKSSSQSNRSVRKNRDAETDIDAQMARAKGSKNSQDEFKDAVATPGAGHPDAEYHTDEKTGVTYHKGTSTNRDGKVHINLLNAPDWMKTALQKLDEDNDGLSQDELLQWLDAIAQQKKAHEANSDEINYELMPEKVQAVMRKWDGDASGSVSVSELALASEAQVKLEKENRTMKLIVVGLVCVVVFLTVASFATALGANETSKDFGPSDDGEGSGGVMEMVGWRRLMGLPEVRKTGTSLSVGGKGKLSLEGEKFRQLLESNVDEENAVVGAKRALRGVESKSVLGKFLNTAHGRLVELTASGEMVFEKKDRKSGKKVTMRRLSTTPEQGRGSLAMKGSGATLSTAVGMQEYKGGMVMGALKCLNPKNMEKARTLSYKSKDGSKTNTLTIKGGKNMPRDSNDCSVKVFKTEGQNEIECHFCGAELDGKVPKNPDLSGDHCFVVNKRSNQRSLIATNERDGAHVEGTSFAMDKGESEQTDDCTLAPTIYQFCRDFSEVTPCPSYMYDDYVRARDAYRGASGESSIPPSQIKDCDNDGMISWGEYKNKMCFEQLQKAARVYDPFVEKVMKDKFYSWSDYMQSCAVDANMLPEDPYAKEMCEWGYVYDFYNWKEAVSSADCESDDFRHGLSGEALVKAMTDGLTWPGFAGMRAQGKPWDFHTQQHYIFTKSIGNFVGMMQEHLQGVYDAPGAKDKISSMVKNFVDSNGYLTKEKFGEMIESTRADPTNMENSKKALAGTMAQGAGAVNPECPYFPEGVQEVWSPEEMAGGADLASKMEDFERMNKFPKDDKVSMDECRKVFNKEITFEKMKSYGQAQETDGDRINVEQFCGYHMSEGKYTSKGACEMIFTMKDMDATGSLDQEQATAGPAEDMQKEKDRNPGCTPTKRVLEAVVNEPRRRNRALKMTKRELRSRMRARRRLQHHPDHHENSYNNWLQRRMSAAEDEVARKQRRLSKERRLLSQSKRRALSIFSNENSFFGRRLQSAGGDLEETKANFMSSVEAEIHDMPISEDFQNMEEGELLRRHRRLQTTDAFAGSSDGFANPGEGAPTVTMGADGGAATNMRDSIVHALNKPECEVTNRVLFDRETRRPVAFRKIRMLSHDDPNMYGSSMGSGSGAGSSMPCRRLDHDGGMYSSTPQYGSMDYGSGSFYGSDSPMGNCNPAGAQGSRTADMANMVSNMNDADLREVESYMASAPDATVMSMRQETGPPANPVAAAMTEVIECAEVESTQGQVCRLAEYLAGAAVRRMRRRRRQLREQTEDAKKRELTGSMASGSLPAANTAMPSTGMAANYGMSDAELDVLEVAKGGQYTNALTGTAAENFMNTMGVQYDQMTTMEYQRNEQSAAGIATIETLVTNDPYMMAEYNDFMMSEAQTAAVEMGSADPIQPAEYYYPPPEYYSSMGYGSPLPSTAAPPITPAPPATTAAPYDPNAPVTQAPYIYTTPPPNTADPYYPGGAADQYASSQQAATGAPMYGSGYGSGSMAPRKLSAGSMGSMGSDSSMGSMGSGFSDPYYGSGYYPEGYISPEEQASIVDMAPEYAVTFADLAYMDTAALDANLNAGDMASGGSGAPPVNVNYTEYMNNYMSMDPYAASVNTGSEMGWTLPPPPMPYPEYQPEPPSYTGGSGMPASKGAFAGVNPTPEMIATAGSSNPAAFVQGPDSGYYSEMSSWVYNGPVEYQPEQSPGSGSGNMGSGSGAPRMLGEVQVGDKNKELAKMPEAHTAIKKGLSHNQRRRLSQMSKSRQLQMTRMTAKRVRTRATRNRRLLGTKAFHMSGYNSKVRSGRRRHLMMDMRMEEMLSGYNPTTGDFSEFGSTDMNNQNPDMYIMNGPDTGSEMYGSGTGGSGPSGDVHSDYHCAQTFQELYAVGSPDAAMYMYSDPATCTGASVTTHIDLSPITQGSTSALNQRFDFNPDDSVPAYGSGYDYGSASIYGSGPAGADAMANMDPYNHEAFGSEAYRPGMVKDYMQNHFPYAAHANSELNAAASGGAGSMAAFDYMSSLYVPAGSGYNSDAPYASGGNYADMYASNYDGSAVAADMGYTYDSGMGSGSGSGMAGSGNMGSGYDSAWFEPVPLYSDYVQPDYVATGGEWGMSVMDHYMMDTYDPNPTLNQTYIRRLNRVETHLKPGHFVGHKQTRRKLAAKERRLSHGDMNNYGSGYGSYDPNMNAPPMEMGSTGVMELGSSYDSSMDYGGFTSESSGAVDFEDPTTFTYSTTISAYDMCYSNMGSYMMAYGDAVRCCFPTEFAPQVTDPYMDMQVRRSLATKVKKNRQLSAEKQVILPTHDEMKAFRRSLMQDNLGSEASLSVGPENAHIDGYQVTTEGATVPKKEEVKVITFFEHVQKFTEYENLNSLPQDHACANYARDEQYGGVYMMFQQAMYYEPLSMPETSYDGKMYYYGYGKPMPRFSTPADFDPYRFNRLVMSRQEIDDSYQNPYTIGQGSFHDYMSSFAIDSSEIDEKCIRRASAQVGRAFPGARVCERATSDGAACQKWIDQSAMYGGGETNSAGQTQQYYDGYCTSQASEWDHVHPNTTCLNDCAMYPSYCLVDANGVPGPHIVTADFPQNIWSEMYYPGARQVFQQALRDCLHDKAECHRAFTDTWMDKGDGVVVENQAAKVQTYFEENKGEFAMGSETYRRARMLSKVPAHTNMKYKGLISQRMRPALSKNGHLNRILKMGSATGTKVARKGTTRARRQARKLKVARIARQLRAKNKDVRKLTGRDRKRALQAVEHARSKKSSVRRQLRKLMDSDSAKKEFDSRRRLTQEKEAGRKLTEEEAVKGRRLMVFNKYGRILKAQGWATLETFLSSEKKEMDGVSCDPMVDGKACDMQGRRLTGYGSGYMPGPSIPDYSSYSSGSTYTTAPHDAATTYDSTTGSYTPVTYESPPVGSALSMDYSSYYDPTDAYGSYASAEEQMDWSIASNIEIVGSGVAQDMEGIYMAAKEEAGCMMAMGSSAGSACGTWFETVYDSMVTAYAEEGVLPQKVEEQKIKDMNIPTVTQEDFRTTKDCKHIETKPLDIADLQELIMAGSEDVPFAMPDQHYRKKGILVKMRRADYCRKCGDQWGPECGMQTALAGGMPASRETDDENMEATIGELETFVADCDAAPMYPEQHPCIGISNDGPICTEARELFEKLKMEFGGAGEGGLDRAKTMRKRDITKMEKDDQCNVVAAKEHQEEGAALATNGEFVLAEMQRSNGEGAGRIMEEAHDAASAGEINMDNANALETVANAMMDATHGTQMSPAEREQRDHMVQEEKAEVRGALDAVRAADEIEFHMEKMAKVNAHTTLRRSLRMLQEKERRLDADGKPAGRKLSELMQSGDLAQTLLDMRVEVEGTPEFNRAERKRRLAASAVKDGDSKNAVMKATPQMPAKKMHPAQKRMLRMAEKARKFVASRAVTWRNGVKTSKSPNRRMLASTLGMAMNKQMGAVVKAAKFRPSTGMKRNLSSKKQSMKNTHLFTKRNKRVSRNLRKLSKKLTGSHKNSRAGKRMRQRRRLTYTHENTLLAAGNMPMSDPNMATNQYTDSAGVVHHGPADIEGIMMGGLTLDDFDMMVAKMAPLVEDTYGPNGEWMPSKVSKKAQQMWDELYMDPACVGEKSWWDNDMGRNVYEEPHCNHMQEQADWANNITSTCWWDGVQNMRRKTYKAGGMNGGYEELMFLDATDNKFKRSTPNVVEACTGVPAGTCWAESDFDRAMDAMHRCMVELPEFVEFHFGDFEAPSAVTHEGIVDFVSSDFGSELISNTPVAAEVVAVAGASSGGSATPEMMADALMGALAGSDMPHGSTVDVAADHSSNGPFETTMPNTDFGSMSGSHLPPPTQGSGAGSMPTRRLADWSPRRLSGLGSGAMMGSMGSGEPCEMDGSCHVVTYSDLNVDRMVQPSDGMIVTMGPAWDQGGGASYPSGSQSGVGQPFGGYEHLTFTAIDIKSEAGDVPTNAADMNVQGLVPGDKIWNQCDIHVMKTGGCMPDEIDFEMFKHGACDALVNKKSDMLEKMVQMYTSTAFPEGTYHDPAAIEMEVRDKIGRWQEHLDGGMFDTAMCHGMVDHQDFGFDLHDVFCSMADAECKCMRVPMHDTLDFVAQCDAAPSQLSMYYDHDDVAQSGAGPDGVADGGMMYKMDYHMYLGGSQGESAAQDAMTELTTRFTDGRSSQAASCFLVTRLRRQLENDEYIHPEVRKLARLPQDFEVRDPSGRRLSGAKNEIQANPHVRRRLSECTDTSSSPVGANKGVGASMPRPMTGDEMMARSADGALPGQENFEAFTPAPAATLLRQLSGSMAPSVFGSGSTPPANAAHVEQGDAGNYMASGSMGSGSAPPAYVGTAAPPAYYSSPAAGMQPAFGSNAGSAPPTYVVNPANVNDGTGMYNGGDMYGSYGSDSFGGSGYEFGYDYENSYASDSYYANSCEELDVLYQDIVADPSDTGYMSSAGAAGMGSGDASYRDPMLMNQAADATNYGTNVAEAARMVASTCHEEKKQMTQHMHTCPAHAMLEMVRYPETNPATNNTFLHDFEDACHAAATRSGACDAAAFGQADWCTVKMSDGMLNNGNGNADSGHYQTAAATLGDCVNHYMHDGMDHEMNGMFHDVAEGTATVDDIMADTLGAPAYTQQTDDYFQSTFDVSPGNPYGNYDCSLDCAAWAADHWEAEMRTNDFEEYPAASGNFMPRIKTWVYNGQTYAQQNYVWNNKEKCNSMLQIPEDSCSASGAHATTQRRVHKCEAMNDHGFNSEISGHMTQRALRSIRKLSAKNKNFGRRLSAGGNKKKGSKMQLRKLRQKQHFERRRRQLSQKGGRRLSVQNEKLELLDVKYLVETH